MGTVLTHIPACVGDLASLTLLQASREQAAQVLRRRSASPDSQIDPDGPRKRVFARSATVPTRQPGVSIFDHDPHNISAKAKSSMHVAMRPLEEDNRKACVMYVRCDMERADTASDYRHSAYLAEERHSVPPEGALARDQPHRP